MICNKLSECYQAILQDRDMPSCCNDRNACIMSADCRKNVKCEEKKKKYILENTEKKFIVSYRMDGGVIVNDKTVPEGTNKNDFVFLNQGNESYAILIELKGENISKALRQIDATLNRYTSFWKNFMHVFARGIVTSSTPRLKVTPEYVNLVKKLKKQYNGNLKIWEKEWTEKDMELLKFQ